MKAQDFESNSKHLIEHCWNLLFNKAKEYASDEDRLANFKQPTSLFGVSPAEICLYYDSKHIASMVMIAQDISKGKLPTRELLEEKVGDYINYGLLFYSTVLEMIEEQEKKTIRKLVETNIENLPTVTIICENCEEFTFHEKDVVVDWSWSEKDKDYSWVQLHIDKDAECLKQSDWGENNWKQRLLIRDIVRIIERENGVITRQINVPWDDETDTEINEFEKISDNGNTLVFFFRKK